MCKKKWTCYYTDFFEVDKEEIRGMKVEANYFEGEKIR